MKDSNLNKLNSLSPEDDSSKQQGYLEDVLVNGIVEAISNGKLTSQPHTKIPVDFSQINLVSFGQRNDIASEITSNLNGFRLTYDAGGSNYRGASTPSFTLWKGD